MKVLIAPPQADGAGAVHHGFDVGAEVAHQIRIGEIARDELGATAHQIDRKSVV